ncbi:hypothetical protein HK107_02220 [Parvularcula sp. ZS-1/3]|uniref:Uncharacterized protein n=1 Tax=Parvularcula mediterranea TaxID=2732508 RepID=A0A7Y3RJC7_9PROT|nr:hypothetical protein [Parvularcula mediterranea]NNU15139.1 hypothetical protein [Parvularcula mediterranea]
MGEQELETVQTIIHPSLDHLIRLEAYYRIHGLEQLATGIDTVLDEVERLLKITSAEDMPGIKIPEAESLIEDAQSDVPVPADPGRRRYSAG